MGIDEKTWSREVWGVEVEGNKAVSASKVGAARECAACRRHQQPCPDLAAGAVLRNADAIHT